MASTPPTLVYRFAAVREIPCATCRRPIEVGEQTWKLSDETYVHERCAP